MTDHEIARALLAARAGTPAPAGTVPADEAQAYRVQALVMAELGEIGGWKVGYQPGRADRLRADARRRPVRRPARLRRRRPAAARGRIRNLLPPGG